MPYIIAIVLVAVAALVFFSRPSSTTAPTDVTSEETTSSVETTRDDNGQIAIADNETGSGPDVPDMTSSVTLSSVATYQTPARQSHDVGVTLTLEGTTITDAEVTYNGDTEAKTPQHRAFDAGYEQYVIGKDINGISLSRVGGASLTTAAFVEAVNEIKTKL